LAIKPRIVLADEPTANLDSKTGSSILALMKDINRHYGTTFIFSTHDRRVMAMADRLIRIEDGRVAMLGVKVSDQWKSVRPPSRAVKAEEEAT
jgi:putative ABC transport system ATP-binding protein